jgi:predicted ATPase
MRSRQGNDRGNIHPSVMTTLKKVTIEGFRSIGKMAKPLELRPLNVLVGANGSGKSNLLAFFRMLNSMMDEKLQLYTAQEGGADALLHFGSKTTKNVRCELEFQTGRGVAEYWFQLMFAQPDRFIFDSEAFSPFLEPPSRSPVLFPAGHREAGIASFQYGDMDEIKPINVALQGLHLYQFNDTSAQSGLRRSHSEEHQIRPFLHDGSNLPSVLYNIRERHVETYNIVRKTIQLIAPFFHDFQFDFEDRQAAGVRDVRLSWRSAGSDYVFGLHHLSDGTLRFIALTVLLLLPPPQRLDGAILIDEPELGLHPKALAVLAGLVRSASEQVQVICATQSPSFLDHFAPEDVIVVERENGNSVFKRLESGPLEAWKEDYSLGQMWTKNLFGGRPQRD